MLEPRPVRVNVLAGRRLSRYIRALFRTDIAMPSPAAISIPMLVALLLFMQLAHGEHAVDFSVHDGGEPCEFCLLASGLDGISGSDGIRYGIDSSRIIRTRCAGAPPVSGDYHFNPARAPPA